MSSLLLVNRLTNLLMNFALFQNWRKGEVFLSGNRNTYVIQSSIDSSEICESRWINLLTLCGSHNFPHVKQRVKQFIASLIYADSLVLYLFKLIGSRKTYWGYWWAVFVCVRIKAREFYPSLVFTELKSPQSRIFSAAPSKLSERLPLLYTPILNSSLMFAKCALSKVFISGHST